MAYQMVYTSIKSGLVAGRSGFCTAARHREISDALVGRIEDLSGQYDRGSLATRQGGVLPVIYSHRVVAIRGKEWHLLMRIADAGTDYSGRTNHIAHTFVLEPGEVAGLRLSPAEIILHLIRDKQWIERYTEAARYFAPEEGPDLRSYPPLVSLPARRWQSETGAASNAALLMESQAAMGAGVVSPEGNDPELLLTLFAESQLIGSPDRSKPASLWTRSFTTLMQSSEQRGDFDWYVCPYNSPVHMQMLKANRYLVELSRTLASPKGRFADIAEGKQVAEEVPLERRRVETVAEVASVPVGGTDPTSPHLVIPMASLRPTGDLLVSGRRRERRKEGLPVWVLAVGGLAVLGLVAVIAMMLFGTSESEKYAEKIEELLRNGDWAGAGNLLSEMGEDEKKLFRENPKFEALEDTYKVAKDYQWILENDPASAPPGTGTSDSVGFLEYVNGLETGLLKTYKKDEVQLESFPTIATLKARASDRVASYQALLAGLQQDWESLKKGKTNGLNFEDFSAPNREEFRDQIEDLEATKKIVGEFETFRVKEHENIKDAKKVSDEMAGRVNQQVAEAEGKMWEPFLKEIYRMIGDFKPKEKVVAHTLTENTDTSKTESEMPVETEAKELPQIPVTYFWRVNDGNTYSYQGIPELAGAFPKVPYLTAKMTFEWDELSKIRTEGLFVASNIYSEKEKLAPVFKVGSTLTLEPIPGFPDRYKQGYLLALGDKQGEKPQLQVVAQSASTSFAELVTRPFFLHFPMDRALKKEGGTVIASGELKEILGLFRFPPTKEPVFHLVRVGESGMSHWREKDPKRLQGELVGGLEQDLVQKETEEKRYGAKKNLDEKFENVFGKLGEVLFCELDGKRPIYKLDYKPLSNTKNKGEPLFIQTDTVDKEADGITLCKTLADYKPSSSERNLLIDYVNIHVLDVFLEWGGDKGASKFAEGVTFLTESLDVNLPPETTFENWLKITRRSAEKKWSTLPDISPVKDEGVAKNRQGAYPHTRFRADFFKRWESVFTDENVKLARDKLLGGEYSEAVHAKMKEDIKKLKTEIAKVGDKDLRELGNFYVVVEADGAYFRIVAIQ